MYDVRDSVDDDRLEKYSVDSLENGEFPLKSIKPFDKGLMRSSEPFRLHGEGRLEPRLADLPGQKLFRVDGGNRNLTRKSEIDEDVLISKGLHVKEDGSFCRSPREELPFIMPASRVAQIRRKKQVSAKKNSRDEIGWSQFGEAGSVRNMTECIPASNDDISRLKTRENLTDSMKQALCKTYKKRRCHAQGKVSLSSGKGTSFLPKFEKPAPGRCAEGKHGGEESVRKLKFNKSDFKLPCEPKTRLSYYERYQKKKGFDPESISKKGCKPPGDSARSILGDITRRDTLSEVSGNFASDDVDDSEESFYERIIAREKLKMGNCTGEKGEVGGGGKQEVTSAKGSSRKKVKNRNDAVRPPVTNASLILLSGRKSHRLCAVNPETMPKGELASRARAYGNLASTRNMAKLQMKSPKADKNRTFSTSSAPSSDPSDLQAGKSENSGRDPESREWRSFLPPLVDSGKREVDLPWETRNLLMQISAERDVFKQSMNNLKSRIGARDKERVWFDGGLGCREPVAEG